MFFEGGSTEYREFDLAGYVSGVPGTRNGHLVGADHVSVAAVAVNPDPGTEYSVQSFI